MVKRGSSSFSASSVAKGLMVLSKAIEKQFALEAEVSRLRHHVSVLSKRLHSVTLERQILADIVDTTMRKEEEEKPLGGEEVAGEGMGEEAAPSVADEGATVYVAEEEKREGGVAGEDATTSVAEVAEEMRIVVASPVVGQEPEPCVAEPSSEGVPEMAEEYNRFAMDLVEDVGPIQSQKSDLSRLADLRDEVKRKLEEMMRTGRACLETPENLDKIVENSGNTVDEVRRLGSSGEEDVVIGGVIVAGGASTKRKTRQGGRREN